MMRLLLGHTQYVQPPRSGDLSGSTSQYVLENIYPSIFFSTKSETKSDNERVAKIN